MGRNPTSQQRAEAKTNRHDASIWRMAAGHRARTDQGRQQAAADRAHAAKLDRQANRKDPDR